MPCNHIWILLDSRQFGGIESHVYQLAQGLQLQQHAVTVVFLNNYGEHPLCDALSQQGIGYMQLDGTWRSLWRALRQYQPQLLHTHGYKAGIYGRVAARLNQTPVISTYHAGELVSGKLACYDWLDRVTARLADQVVSVSPQIAQRLPCSAPVMNNFINTTGLERSVGKQIAFVGRLSHEKGADHFLRLARENPQQSFHLYGDGPERHQLTDCAPANLHCHGQQQDMAAVWADIGLLIMPSRHEGLPMAALEAMARGIPVLAYRVGALESLITSARNGWLIEPGNFQALSQSFWHWLQLSRADKQRISDAAQATITAHFSTTSTIPKLLSYYSKIAN